MSKATSGFIDVQRVRIDAEGYDESGGYWGEGPDVFMVTQGLDEVTLRAKNMKEARQKAEAALAAERERRTSLKMQRYAMEWVNPVSGETYVVRIEHRADYFYPGMDHVEIETRVPKRAPLPITQTGYLSHFIAAAALEAAGGPEAFVRDWLKRAGADPVWRLSEEQRRQGDLFGWADAQAEATTQQKPQRQPRRRKSAKPEPKPE